MVILYSYVKAYQRGNNTYEVILLGIYGFQWDMNGIYCSHYQWRFSEYTAVDSITNGSEWIVNCLVICHSLLLKTSHRDSEFHIKHGGSFHSYVSLPEAICMITSPLFHQKFWCDGSRVIYGC